MVSKRLIPWLVFLFPLLWILFLNQNVPFSTMDDPTIHYLAKTSSYEKILSRIINPLTPAWTYQFQALGGEQNSLGLRPFELLIWKTLQTLFGYQVFPFYFAKGLFLSLVTLVVYFFSLKLTQRRGASALAALFYATTLSCYNSVTVITVFDLLAQSIQGLAIFLFLRLYLQNQKTDEPAKKTAMDCAVLFLTLWLAIKTYETTKIAPLMFTAFIGLMFWRDPFQWLRQKNNLMLLGTVLLMGILVAPFTGSYQVYDAHGATIQNQASLSYHWDTLYRFVLQNTRNAWEAEPDIALFSLKSYLPFSIARTFGFFLCWLVLFGAGALLVSARKLRSLDASRRNALIFVCVWTAADMAALGLPKESDGRHLMAPLIPLTILSAFLLCWTYEQIPSKTKKAFAGACLLGWAFAFFTNAGHNIYFRKFIGGTQIAQDKYMKYIYKDMHGTEPSYDDLIRFMRVPEALSVWHIPFIVNDLYGYKVDDNDTERTGKLKPEYLSQVRAKYGKVYIVTPNRSQIPDDTRYVLVGKFDEINESFFTDWVLRFKKKRGGTHHVFQFIPA